jgi:peptidoglycan LD-endopeptidase LytH
MVSKVLKCLLIIIVFMSGCENILEKRTPYEDYLESLDESGLLNTEAGRLWKNAGEQVFQDSLLITLPYREILFFSPVEQKAESYRFHSKRGEQIIINVKADSAQKSLLFIDLFLLSDEYKHIAAADTPDYLIHYTVEESGSYFLRLQPELLAGGKYELTIMNAPSLAFPVYNKDSRAIKSFWGDRRDGGRRDHKGVDIFAEKGTPVLAAADGVVSRTGTNNLGGKVVWLSTINKSLYYAHLDSQTVTPTQIIKTGDTLGFVGNTGNARFTPPHLHFGIYYHGEGAVDPLPYIKNYYASVDEPQLNESVLGSFARSISTTAYRTPAKSQKIKIKTAAPVLLKGIVGKYYKAEESNGSTFYLEDRQISFKFPNDKNTSGERAVFYLPDSSSYKIGLIPVDSTYINIGSSGIYTLIDYKGLMGWIKTKNTF